MSPQAESQLLDPAGLNTILAGVAQPVGQSRRNSQEQGLSQYSSQPGKQLNPRGSMSGRQLQSGTIRVGPMAGIDQAGPGQRRPVFFQQEIQGDQGGTVCRPMSALKNRKGA